MIRTLIAARWFPYALIGIPVVVAVVFGWGYLKGYDKAETAMLEKMNEALSDQLATMQKIHRSDLVALQRATLKKSEVSQRVDDIQRPAGPAVALGPDWLRAYNDGVRAANAGSRATDQGSAAAGGGAQ